MKKKIFSGVQPTGVLHIGNYLGAIKNWVKLQEEYESIFCVVDLHAITVPQDPQELKKKVLEVAKLYLACGIDPEKSTIFIQSQIKEHTELTWILNTIAQNGELARMHQFKDKTDFDMEKFYKDLEKLKNKKIEKVINKDILKGVKEVSDINSNEGMNIIYQAELGAFIKVHKEFMNKFNKINTGLFDYPVLMAADILLYDTEVVPVGEDQKQHIELARTLAKRFNQRFGEIFKIPEAIFKKEGMRIMGLDNPEKKMSKSASSEYNYISLLDDPDMIRKKIKKSVTDSGSEIKYNPEEKPAIANLMHIYSLFSDKKLENIEKDYAGKNYGEFKTDLAEVIVKGLNPIQEKFQSLKDEEVLKILQEGAQKLKPLAEAKMKEVKEKVGFWV